MLNPVLDELPLSALDLVVAGTVEGVLMVESEAHELSEEVMLGAVTFGHEQMQPVIDLIISLAEVAAKDPLAGSGRAPAKAEVYEALKSSFGEALAAAAHQSRQGAAPRRHRGRAGGSGGHPRRGRGKL